MVGKEDEALANEYESDQGETEDEEVKRNCIMGQSGMTDSDFSDSDFDTGDVEEEEETVADVDVDVDVDVFDENKEEEDGTIKENRREGLVKFVSSCGQILMPNGVVLYRPTPIMPTLLVLDTEEPEENEETFNNLKVKSNLSANNMNTKSGFSPTPKPDNETEMSTSPSSWSSSSIDSSDADTESVGSDTQMKSTSLDFSFDEGEKIPETVDIEEGCCKSSSDDQHQQQETMTENYALVGASGASVDDKWQMAKQKRVLSSNTLSALNQEAGRNADSPKRMRCSRLSFKDICAIPEITLGIEALDQIIQPLPRQYLMRDDFSLIPSSSDEEEDRMLSEELEEKFRNTSMGGSGGDTSPIPLLTPPQSPRTVNDTIEGSAMTTIEWPSNLVMDSAFMKATTTTATNVKLLSPVSIDNNDDEQLMKYSPSILDNESSSSLAPLLRSIYVGNI